ncbi:PREDICTED: putative inositol monophosphatase 3 [Nicrophorus vespilloides]|uniref:inositol-phosphate phosphatase n=1 Tax=Nicrophorus vespilloides TaxID=110193 RepID=A0ABM1MTC2_NICVS|nr:PREDICTED: putative inositol monophosphatase 3 [Nicrophorus vespilloides]
MNLGGAIHLNRTGFLIICGISCLLLFYVISNRSNATTHNSLKDAPQVDLKKLLGVAIRAAKNGGIEVVSVKDKLTVQSKGKTKEGLNDVVTTADFQSHCAMKATIKHHFPNVVVVSEEAKAECKDENELDYSFGKEDEFKSLPPSLVYEKDITVWIDPLDATKEYTEKLYHYVTTMVCVAVNGRPIMGIIYKPFSNESFWSWVGNGQSNSIKSILIPADEEADGEIQEEDDTELKVIVSKSHSGKIKENLQKNMKRISITEAAGSGFKVLEVVAGKADVYVHNTAIKKWDICAGDAILESLDGKLTTSDNFLIDYSDTFNVVNYNGIIASMHKPSHNKFIGKL